MNYSLDCEFNGYQGELLSLALYRQDGASLYGYIAQEKVPMIVKSSEPALRYDGTFAIARQFDPWVQEHVVPHLLEFPEECGWHCVGTREQVRDLVANFLHGDSNPIIHVDWPDDIKYFCELLITGPGTMVEIPRVQFQLHRVESYPHTGFPNAIRHNAWWDARLLWDRICAVIV